MSFFYQQRAAPKSVQKENEKYLKASNVLLFFLFLFGIIMFGWAMSVCVFFSFFHFNLYRQFHAMVWTMDVGYSIQMTRFCLIWIFLRQKCVYVNSLGACHRRWIAHLNRRASHTNRWDTSTALLHPLSPFRCVLVCAQSFLCAKICIIAIWCARPFSVDAIYCLRFASFGHFMAEFCVLVYISIERSIYLSRLFRIKIAGALLIAKMIPIKQQRHTAWFDVWTNWILSPKHQCETTDKSEFAVRTKPVASSDANGFEIFFKPAPATTSCRC